MLINGEKWACEPCVRGHRVTSCKHRDRPVRHIKRRGRPSSTCSKCHDMICARPEEHSKHKTAAKKPAKELLRRNIRSFLPIVPRPVAVSAAPPPGLVSDHNGHNPAPHSSAELAAFNNSTSITSTVRENNHHTPSQKYYCQQADCNMDLEPDHSLHPSAPRHSQRSIPWIFGACPESAMSLTVTSWEPLGSRLAERLHSSTFPEGCPNFVMSQAEIILG